MDFIRRRRLSPLYDIIFNGSSGASITVSNQCTFIFAESSEEQVISSVKLRRCISTAIDDESEVLRMRGYLICVDQRPADGMIDSIRI